MGETSTVNLSEIIELIGGGTPKTSIPEYWGGDIPWLSVVDFNNGKKYVFDTEKKITTEGLNNSSTKLLHEGDIIISARGTVGVISVLGKQMAFNQSCYGVRAKESLSLNDYIYYLLKDTVSNFLLISHGGVFDTITRDTFKEIDVLLPPLPEQKAIATVLSSLDDKIDLLHRQNKTLEAMAETLFRQRFVEEAQDDWKEKPLKDILEFVVDNRGKTAPTAETGIPLIATNCIKNNNIFPIYEKLRYVSEDTYKTWFRAHPIPGDIIFVNKGTPGCINLVPDPIDFCIAQDMIALRVNKFVSNYYLFLYLRSEEFQFEALNFSVGTTIPHFKKTDLLNFPITIPGKSIQKDFETIVAPFFLKMNSSYLQIRTLEKLRDNLLPKLMCGEVRVGYENG